MARPISYDPDDALERAMNLFWRHGYHAVSIEQIVSKTGLNRHSLYSHYGNKYGLLLSALERYCEQAVGSINGILADGDPPRTRIDRLLHLRHPSTAESFWARMLERGCLATRTTAELRDTHPEVGSSLTRIGQALHALLMDTVKQGQDSGAFSTRREPAQLAAVITAGFMSFTDTPGPDERIAAFMSLLDAA